MKEYVTIQNDEIALEKIIEKSCFIAAAKHVNSAEEAAAFVEAKKKKYYDATHNCYAYVVGDKAKFSDDGEPQSTAGMPIYECIKNNGLDFTCVVVTRYFGGIKLGAGGLTRAYGGCCADVLAECKRISMRSCLRADITVEYSLLKPLRRALQGLIAEESVEYSDKVCIRCLFLEETSTTISNIVSENTLGKGIVEIKERTLSSFDILSNKK